MAFMYGYGVMTDYNWASVDKILALLDLAPQYKAEVQSDLDDILTDEGVSNFHEMDPIDGKDALLEALQDENGEDGIHIILSRVIEEVEGITLTATTDDNAWPFLLLDIRAPWNLPHKVKNLTEEQMDNIFRKYISMVTDEPVEIGYQFI